MNYSIIFIILDVRLIFISIINNGFILGCQDSSRRQTVLFLPIDPRDKDLEDPEHIEFSVPRRARYVHSECMEETSRCGKFWVDIDLAIKGTDILSDTIE